MKAKYLKTLPACTLVGRGELQWFRNERVSDRYGSCFVFGDGEMWFPEDGASGKLIARVIDAKESSHIGDFFRGLRPVTPKTGDILELGNGHAFREFCEGRAAIGVRPEKERDSDWLNPRALYNIHMSIVELYWVPKSNGKAKP